MLLRGISQRTYIDFGRPVIRVRTSDSAEVPFSVGICSSDARHSVQHEEVRDSKIQFYNHFRSVAVALEELSVLISSGGPDVCQNLQRDVAKLGCELTSTSFEYQYECPELPILDKLKYSRILYVFSALASAPNDTTVQRAAIKALASLYPFLDILQLLNSVRDILIAHPPCC